MMTLAAGVIHALDAVLNIAAVVENEEEIIVLHGLDQLLDIDGGELVEQFGREEASGRFGKEDAVRPGGLVFLGTGDKELGRLIEEDFHILGIHHGGDERVGDLHEVRGKRERPEHAAHNGTVGDDVLRAAGRLGENIHAAGVNIRNLQRMDGFHIGHRVLADGGNHIFGIHDLAAERFGIHGEVHAGNGGDRLRIAVENLFHDRNDIVGIADRLRHSKSAFCGQGEVKNGKIAAVLGGDDFLRPFLHIDFHRLCSFLVYVRGRSSRLV